MTSDICQHYGCNRRPRHEGRHAHFPSDLQDVDHDATSRIVLLRAALSVAIEELKALGKNHFRRLEPGKIDLLENALYEQQE